MNVAVFFGGTSPEHEVSVISSLQAAAAMDRDRFTPVPIYVDKSGTWYTGEHLFDIERYRDLDALTASADQVHFEHRQGPGAVLVGAPAGWLGKRLSIGVDAAFLGFHGGAGESGAFQGLCETFGVAYTGSGVLGSSLGMDKILTKMLCRDQGIPVVEWVAFRESDWIGNEEAWLDRIEGELTYPLIVKPARLGSSIGITKATERDRLDAAIEEALRYDDKVVVERAITALREINCSVLGNPDEATASVLEEPVRTEGEELLTFAEKYQRGGGKSASGKSRAPAGPKAGGAAGMASLDRQIPAHLTAELAREISELGVRVFQLFECSGVARIDFLLDGETEQVYFNEINTIPGSFSFYLWEPSGVPFRELISRMIDLGLDRYRNSSGRIQSYETNLLSERSLAGLKGAKS